MANKESKSDSRSTSKKSSTRSTSQNSSPDPTAHQSKSSQLATIIGFVIVVILGGIFLVTGADPLGMFTSTQIPEIVFIPEVSTGGGGRGEWWNVYFTEPNTINDPENLKDSIPEKLIAYIDEAQKSIHIAAFEFNLTPVAEALIAAHERGVDVRWVTDDEYGLEADEEDDHGQFAMLEDAGIEVRDDRRTALMHNKFWIFDGQIVWTGSTNITKNGNFRNNNNVIVINSPQLAAIFEREFDEMWAGEFGPRSTSTLDQQFLTINGTPVQVYFSAEDEVITHLLPLIAGAQKSIYFMAFSFTNDDLEKVMMERFEAGVNVKGIFETRGSETEYSAMPFFYCAKIPVLQDGNPGTFHHKVIILDAETVITGSLNFSDNADTSNDENTIVIKNKDIAALYIQEFERRWAEAEEPDPADMGCK